MVLLVLATAACGGGISSQRSSYEVGARGADYVVVGSGGSPESQIMASLYAQAIDDEDMDVVRELDLGSDAMAFRALRKHVIDLTAQPVGSLTEALHGTPDSGAEEARADLEQVLPEGFRALDVSGADRRYAVVVTGRTAEARDLRAVADLAGQDLVVGGPPGCLARASCLPDLAAVLGPDLSARFLDLDDGGPRTKDALVRGVIDVAVLPSTDAAIRAHGWIRLEESDRFRSPSNAFLPVVRTDALDDRARRAVDRVSRELTEDALRDMVDAVTVRQEDPEAVASDYLRERERARG